MIQSGRVCNTSLASEEEYTDGTQQSTFCGRWAMRIKNEYSAHTDQIAPRCDTLARKRKGFFSIFSVRYSASEGLESLDTVDCVVTYSTRRVPMALATIEGLHPGFNLKHGIPANGASRNNQPRHTSQSPTTTPCSLSPHCPTMPSPTVGSPSLAVREKRQDSDSGYDEKKAGT
jgi:hypothetical protein